jgi:hypothetical protein
MDVFMSKDVGRLDGIIAQLEGLHREANEVLDVYTDELMCNSPRGTSWGAVKRWLVAPAGSTTNYIAALKLVREKLAGISK